MRRFLHPPFICLNRIALGLSLLLGISLLALTNCSPFANLFLDDEEEFERAITFNEWLYKPGSHPQIKYSIEKNVDADLQLEAAMTLYSDGELVGINTFAVNLRRAINIDYFTIDPDINKPVTRIELKNIHLNDREFKEITKTFDVSEEASE